VRLRIEKDPESRSQQMKVLGVHMFQHAFKSELGKIQVAAKRIFHLAQSTNQPDFCRDASYLINATERMLAMAVRFPTQQLILFEQPCELSRMIESILCKLDSNLSKKKMVVQKELDESIIMYCDPVHIQEVLKNVLVNAIGVASANVENITHRKRRLR